jgi:septum site-determining protein MinD
VICDSPAGIEKGAALAMRHADLIIGMLAAKTAKAESGRCVDKYLLLTRYDPVRARRGEIMKVEDVLEILTISAAGHHPGERGGTDEFKCWSSSDLR